MKARTNLSSNRYNTVPQAKAEALPRRVYFTPRYVWRAAYAAPVALLAGLAMVIARVL